MSKNDTFPKSSKKPNNKDAQNKPGALLPGQPGYRTRDGRSGYDPIDMRTEAAHTAGTIIQKIIAGSIRNPVLLLLLVVLGLALIVPLVFAIAELTNGSQNTGYAWNAWTILWIAAIVGLAILINAIRNLIRIVFR